MFNGSHTVTFFFREILQLFKHIFFTRSIFKKRTLVHCIADKCASCWQNHSVRIHRTIKYYCLFTFRLPTYTYIEYQQNILSDIWYFNILAKYFYFFQLRIEKKKKMYDSITVLYRSIIIRLLLLFIFFFVVNFQINRNYRFSK